MGAFLVWQVVKIFSLEKLMRWAQATMRPQRLRLRGTQKLNAWQATGKCLPSSTSRNSKRRNKVTVIIAIRKVVVMTAAICNLSILIIETRVVD